MPYLINTDVPVGSALNRLGSLIDVEINNPLSKDVLSYDPTTNTWVNDDAIGNIVSLTQAEYDALTQEEKMDSKKYYYITDDTITGAPVDDDDVSPTKVWSSQKVDGEIDSLNSALMWKQIATNVTSLSHDLSQYKEILIDIGFQGNVNHNSIHIITAELSATTHYYSSGYYRTTNDSIGVKVGVNTSGVTGGLVYVDGNTSPIASTFSVYAR